MLTLAASTAKAGTLQVRLQLPTGVTAERAWLHVASLRADVREPRWSETFETPGAVLRLDDLPPDDYRVSVRAEDGAAFYYGRAQPVRIGGGGKNESTSEDTSREAVVIRLEAGHPFDGVLRTAEGEVVAGAQVRIANEAWTFTATTDVSGRYRWPSVETGNWSWNATLESGERAMGRVWVPLDEPVFEKRLEPRVTLAGTVRVDGRPAVGAVLTGQDFSAVVDREGRYRIEQARLLSWGDVWFRVDYAGMRFAPSQRLNSASTDIELSTGLIEFTVFDGATPAANESIRLESPNSLGASVETDAHGRVLVRLPEGTYTIRAPIGRSFESEATIRTGSRPARLHLAAVRTIGVTARQAAGRPLGTVQLWLAERRGDELRRLNGYRWSDLGGEADFTIEAPEVKGRLVLLASASTGVLPPLDVDADAVHVTLRFVEGARLDVTPSQRIDRPAIWIRAVPDGMPHWAEELYHRSAYSAGDPVTLLGLLPGRWRISESITGGASFTRIELVDGETKAVRLRPGGDR